MSREGIALAVHLVSHDFDATSIRVFAACAQHGASGIPLASLHSIIANPSANPASHPNADPTVTVETAVGRLWRHGLVEYQHLALAHKSDAEPSKGPEREAFQALARGDSLPDPLSDGSARELHVLVARPDVALWRARALGHVALLRRVRLVDHGVATSLAHALLEFGTLARDELLRGAPDGWPVAQPVDEAERGERESVLAQLVVLGFVHERLPLDAEAKRRHDIHQFLCLQAPKGRLEKDEGKKKPAASAAASSTGKRKAGSASSAGAAAASGVAGRSTSKKQQLVDKGAQVAEKSRISSFVDAVRRAPIKIPLEPAIIASGAALVDDTVLPTFFDKPEHELPLVLQHYLRSGRILRAPMKKYKRPEEYVDQVLTQMRTDVAARAKGQFDHGVVVFEDDGRTPRACELQFCIDPLAMAVAARLEIYFDYLKEQFADAAALIDAAFLLVINAGSVRLLAAELRYAGLVSRERPCVMRRTPIVQLLSLDALAGELGTNTQQVLAALQRLRDAGLVEVEGNQVRFDMRRIQTEVFNRTVDGHVHRWFGANARRVFALLRENPNMLENDVCRRALLDAKETKRAIGELMAADWLRFTELPKGSDWAPSRLYYLWAVPHGEHQRALIRDRAHSTMRRMLVRLDAEHKRLDLKAVLEAGIDVRGTVAWDALKSDAAAAAAAADSDEAVEQQRHLYECAKWLTRVHNKTYTMLTLLFEKLECIEANVNFS